MGSNDKPVYQAGENLGIFPIASLLSSGGHRPATKTPNASSDYDLFVYNSNGSLIGRSERGRGLVDTVSVTNTGSGTLTRYVRVVFYSGGTGATNGRYTLNLNW